MGRVKDHNSRDRRARRYHGNDLCDEVRSSDPGNIEVHVLVAFTLIGSDTISRGNLTSIGFLIQYILFPHDYCLERLCRIRTKKFQSLSNLGDTIF